MDKNKFYIVTYRCRKCGEEFEDGINDPLMLLNTYNIRHSGHICRRRVSDDEKILVDVLSYRKNREYQPKNKEL